MKNIDRLARFITKDGPDGILIHTIPKTNNWIVCQKIEINKWFLTLMNPMGNVTFNLGTVTNIQHLQLWEELTQMKIENKVSQIQLRKELKDKINNFIKNYEQNFEIFKKAIDIRAKESKKMHNMRKKTAIIGCATSKKTKSNPNHRTNSRAIDEHNGRKY